MIICTKCGIEKSRNEFHKHATRKTGLAAWCKGCCAENMRKQYLKNREEIIAKATAHNKSNPHRKEITKRNSQKASIELQDIYVRRQISKRSRIAYKDVPVWLINVERELIRLKRAINEHR